MRKKKPLPDVVEKYILFLKDVQQFGETDQFTMTGLIKDYGINKTIRKALIELAIINYTNNKHWYWLSFSANRTLALTVLNHLNELAKSERVTPIAGFEEFVTAIKAQTEIMSKVSRELQSVATELKNSQINDVGLQPELFTIDSQRLQVACAIASGVYNKAFTFILNPSDTASIEETNQTIVKATDHLISLLLNKA